VARPCPVGSDLGRSGSEPHPRVKEFLVACLQREVSARESHGGEGRIRAARFPARKSLEEFDFDHARSLKRDTIAHLGTLDFADSGTSLHVESGGQRSHATSGFSAAILCRLCGRVCAASGQPQTDQDPEDASAGSEETSHHGSSPFRRRPPRRRRMR
jgi:hypothetical protein